MNVKPLFQDDPHVPTRAENHYDGSNRMDLTSDFVATEKPQCSLGKRREMHQEEQVVTTRLIDVRLRTIFSFTFRVSNSFNFDFVSFRAYFLIQQMKRLIAHIFRLRPTIQLPQIVQGVLNISRLQ